MLSVDIRATEQIYSYFSAGHLSIKLIFLSRHYCNVPHILYAMHFQFSARFCELFFIMLLNVYFGILD